MFHLAAQAGVRASWGREFSRYSDHNVLATQRTLFLQQDSLAVSNGALLQDFVLVYKAFGAGWQDIEIVKPPENSAYENQ